MCAYDNTIKIQFEWEAHKGLQIIDTKYSLVQNYLVFWYTNDTKPYDDDRS